MSNHDLDKPLYTIGIAAGLCGVNPRLLRLYDQENLVTPFRGENNRRLYSGRDIEKIRHIYYLNQEKRVNLQGIKIILELESFNKATF